MRFIYLLLPLLLFACKQAEAPTETAGQLGELHESFTVNEAAKPSFERGLLLLHNFEYEDAREAFIEAQELDSNAIMSYWGEAMSFNHPLWRRQEFEDGVAALEKLGADSELRAARAGTDLERDFLRGAEILFGEGEKDERDQAYSDHMKMMYETYPGHEEVATFYALSILGAVPVGRDIEAYEAGAEVAKGVLATNPNHPGALHYLIHSYDDPTHAPLALEAAASYSQVAADAVHALHMPSHIFLAVGMYEEVVSSNIASFAASKRRMEEKGLDFDALSYHALSWLQYGYLQLGNIEEAKRIMDDMIAYTDSIPSRNAREYCIAMKGAYLINTGDWDHPISSYEINTEKFGLVGRTQIQFMDGMLAFKAGDLETLEEISETLEEDIEASSLLVEDSGVPMCSAGGTDSYAVNQLDLGHATVMAYQLRALATMIEGTIEDTEKWLQMACNLESELSFDFGPPMIMKPSHEMYGEWLIEQGRQEEANVQFEKTLERTPKRRISTLALEQSI